MKFLLLFISVLILCRPVSALHTTPAEKKIDTDIHKVRLYLNGAEISRRGDVTIIKGENILRVKGISRFINAKSIQVKFGVQMNILSIATDVDYLKAEDVYPELVAVNDSIEIINDKVTDLKNKIDAVETEKHMLLVNLQVKGDQNNLSLEELAKAADFINKRIYKINKSISSMQKEVNGYNRLSSILLQRKKRISNRGELMQTNILITIESTQNITTQMNLSYVVYNAAWKPVYDIIANDLSKPLELKYKAKILNNTEIDWQDVKLVCSTGDPGKGINRPYLKPWTLNYQSQFGYIGNEGRLNTFAVGAYNYTDVRTDSVREMKNIKLDKPMPTSIIEVADLIHEFDIAEIQDVPAGRKPRIIELESHELKATYEHLAIPKMDKDAFLLARVCDWEQLHLIDGVANVYYKQTYIGQSMLNTRFVEDTLDFSLGRANQLLVTRTKKQDFSKKRMIGSSKKESLAYEIIVKNNHNVPVKLELQDQIPVSQEGDIKVSGIEISGAEFNDRTGLLTWNVSLEPGESKSYLIEFSVEYPKNQEVKLRQTRAINCPSF